MTVAFAPRRLRWEQFPRFQHDFCDRTWGVDARRDVRSAPFAADLEVRSFGRGELNRFEIHGGLAIGRGQQRVARDASVGLALSVIETGHGTVSVDGREHVFTAGDVSMLHGAMAFEKRMASQHYRELLLLLSASAVQQLHGMAIDPMGAVVARRDGLAPFLADYIRVLASRAPASSPAELDALLRSILVLVAEVFGTRSKGGQGVDSRELQRQRVQRFIAERLDDPELTPGHIAEHNRMSLRYLHKLFEGTGATVAQTILEQRLERCRVDLTTPCLAHLRVSEIAFSWGFTDAAHFSRAFKIRYGMTPLEARGRAS